MSDVFNDVDAFWSHVRRSGGDRQKIDAVSSPMVYTDIEDKIDQLRTRMDNIEARLDNLDSLVTLFMRKEETWQKKRKSSKGQKRKQLE